MPIQLDGFDQPLGEGEGETQEGEGGIVSVDGTVVVGANQYHVAQLVISAPGQPLDVLPVAKPQPLPGAGVEEA